MTIEVKHTKDKLIINGLTAKEIQELFKRLHDRRIDLEPVEEGPDERDIIR